MYSNSKQGGSRTEMTTEGFKYSIKFNQSVTTGVIGFSGEYNFNEKFTVGGLLNMLKEQEKAFKLAGYRVASDIEPKEGKKEKEVKETDGK